MIEVIAIAGLATIQDGGRPGHMHEGVPPGGPLVPELLARANAAAHNRQGDAAIELFGSLTVVARDGATLSADDGKSCDLQAGETRTFRGEGGRVRYVAVRGGVDVPKVLGGRGTLLVAHLGGLEGRPLRRGDVLRAGRAPAHDDASPGAPDPSAPIRVVLGPDLDRFDRPVVDSLLSETFLVSAPSDRVGMRLTGPRLTSNGEPAAISAPMVRGAIQVTPSGELIVLGPDHPTVGGYPVIATVVRRHLGWLAVRNLGEPVRFVI